MRVLVSVLIMTFVTLAKKDNYHHYLSLYVTPLPTYKNLILDTVRCIKGRVYKPLLLSSSSLLYTELTQG